MIIYINNDPHRLIAKINTPKYQLCKRFYFAPVPPFCNPLLRDCCLLGDKSTILDPDNVDPTTHPLYSKTTPYRAVLLPGDVLFLPGRFALCDIDHSSLQC